jgi:hypothetical protein
VVAATGRRRFATWKLALRSSRPRTRCGSGLRVASERLCERFDGCAGRPAGTEEVRNVGQILALKNGALNPTANKQVYGADTAYHLTWTAFNGVILGGKPKLDAEIASGDIKLEAPKRNSMSCCR